MSGEMTKVLQFTRVVPSGIEDQLAVLESWHKVHGQPICSLNHFREYAAVKNRVPEWVRPVEARFAQHFGGEYLSFAAIHSAVRQLDLANDDVVVLSGSDIGLQDPKALAELLRSPADMVFAARQDVNEDGTAAEVYTKGYGVFALRPPAVDVLAMPDFYFGVAWWDYILPLSAIAARLSVSRFETRAFTGIIHPEPLSPTAFDYVGRECIRQFLPPEAFATAPNHDTVQKFARATNTFLNSPMMGNGQAVDPAELWQAFLSEVERTLEIELPRGSAPKRPEPSARALALADRAMPVSAPTSANGKAKYVLLISIRNDPAMERLQRKFERILKRNGLSGELGFETCSYATADDRLAAAPEAHALILYPEPDRWIAEDFDEGSDVAALLEKWHGFAERIIDLEARYGARASVAGRSTTLENPAAVLAAVAAHAGVELPQLQGAETAAVHQASARTRLARLAIAGAAMDTNEINARLEALAVVPTGSAETMADDIRWLFDHEETTQDLIQPLQQRLQTAVHQKAKARKKLNETLDENTSLEQRLAAAVKEIDALKNAPSWRIINPLRLVRGLSCALRRLTRAPTRK